MFTLASSRETVCSSTRKNIYADAMVLKYSNVISKVCKMLMPYR